jgi:hypothetical protein
MRWDSHIVYKHKGFQSMEIAVLRNMLAWLMPAEWAGAGNSSMSHFPLGSVPAMPLRGERGVTRDSDGSKALRPHAAVTRRASGVFLSDRVRITVEKKESGVFFLTLSPSALPGLRRL